MINFPITGNALIDAEHRKLAEKLSSLHSLLFNIEHSEKIYSLIDSIIIDFLSHSNTEEVLIASLKTYPVLKEHFEEHEQVIKEMLEFKNYLQLQITEQQLEFNSAMSSWISHMNKYDQDLAKLIDLAERKKLTSGTE